MFHMLSCLNLNPGVTIGEFRESVAQFATRIQDLGLAEATGPIGRRQRHPIMDTDDERDHDYFFVMSFLDREQCDRAVSYIQARNEPVESIHEAMWSKIADPVFICWEDI